jgi:hypothetical protein
METTNCEEKLKKKDLPCSWTDRFSIVKIDTLLKALYRLNVILIEIPMKCFTEIEKTILGLDVMAHTWNPSYLGDRDWEDHSLRLQQVKSQ